jgi:low temperature requirement protein LtrA
VITSFLGTGVRFELRVSHFVERHGLLLLVALGESIIAIGAGVPELTLRFILAAVLGLLLTAALWWIYFARDEEIAREHMLARPNPEQLRQALGAFFYAFIPMLFGIILLASGIKSSMEHLATRLDISHAFAFGGGVGLYLIGTVVFRRASGISLVVFRYAAAGLALLTSFLGGYLSAALQFACLILILVLLVLAESDWLSARRPG